MEGSSRALGTVRSLTLFNIQHMLSLQQLVGASLPAGAQPSWIHSIKLRCIDLLQFSPESMLGCCFLGHLTSLDLFACRFAVTDGEPLGTLLQQAPRLQNLLLDGCFERQPLPPALLSRSGLLRLSLQENDLHDLAPGPYLHSE